MNRLFATSNHRCGSYGTGAGFDPKTKFNDRNRTQAQVLAYGLAGLMALSLISGLATAGTSFAHNAPPWPLVNVAVFFFLLAATVVSSGIVVTFWHHLMESLDPASRPFAPPRHHRPPRPLRKL